MEFIFSIEIPDFFDYHIGPLSFPEIHDASYEEHAIL
jgi:hypothetical protein